MEYQFRTCEEYPWPFPSWCTECENLGFVTVGSGQAIKQTDKRKYPQTKKTHTRRNKRKGAKEVEGNWNLFTKVALESKNVSLSIFCLKPNVCTGQHSGFSQSCSSLSFPWNSSFSLCSGSAESSLWQNWMQKKKTETGSRSRASDIVLLETSSWS